MLIISPRAPHLESGELQPLFYLSQYAHPRPHRPYQLHPTIEIGPTLRLVDKLNPGMANGPSGNFCLLMSLRFTEDTAMEQSRSEAPAPAIAA
jgi:hypothetical protein